MALIYCPECNNKVSTKAATCPHCGVQIAGNLTGNERLCPLDNSAGNTAATAQADRHDAFAGRQNAIQQQAAGNPAARPLNIPQQPQQHPQQPTQVQQPQQQQPQVTQAPQPQQIIPQPIIIQQQAPQPYQPIQQPYQQGQQQYQKGHDEEEHEEAGKKSKKKGGRCFIIALITLIAVGSVGFYLYSSHKAKIEMEDYKAAMASTNPQDMLKYLNMHPKAPQEHRDSVKARIDKLTANDEEWQEVEHSDSADELLKYAETHPDSPHRAEALNKADSLDYARAEKANTAEAYKEYLNKHPNGKYQANAKKAIEQINDREVKPAELAKAKDVCRKFLQALNGKDEMMLTNCVEEFMDYFNGKSDMTSHDVVEYMHALYKDEIKNFNFRNIDDFSAKKTKTNDGYNTRVTFKTLKRTAYKEDRPELEEKYTITADINPEGKICSIQLAKSRE